MDARAAVRDFLTSRRSKVTLDEVGLHEVGDRPRRVPGLRREEVAYLAGVSVDYYTRLERGHVEGASDEVLNALARALRLTEAERLHLFALARPANVAHNAPPPHVVRPHVQRVLDTYGGLALVRNRHWDYLAANALGRAVYEEIFDGHTGPPNQMRYVFLDERARAFFDDWAATAHDSARILRSEAGRNPHDPALAALIEELSAASAEFREVWARQDVRLPATGRHVFHHPRAGTLTLVFESASLRADPELTLLLATADPETPTEKALGLLTLSLSD